MEFWGEVLFETVRFLFLAGMALLGIFAGKKLRDYKTARDAGKKAPGARD